MLQQRRQRLGLGLEQKGKEEDAVMPPAVPVLSLGRRRGDGGASSSLSLGEVGKKRGVMNGWMDG